MNERIKEVRKYLELNQDDFAQKLGLTKNYISLVETGNRSLADRTIKDMCRIFHIREEWLRTGEGSMTYEPSREEKIAEISAKIFMRNDLNPEDEETLLQLINAAVDLTPEQIRSVIDVAQTIAKKFGLPD